MAAILRRTLARALYDVREQYLCPHRSIAARLLSKYWSRRSKALTLAAINELGVKTDHNVLEVGYGRGDGIDALHNMLDRHDGCIFGMEASNFMHRLATKRFGIDVGDSKGKIELDEVDPVLNLYPYPDRFFDSAFHVHVFPSWLPDQMYTALRELHRVLRPDTRLVCGLDLKWLRTLCRVQMLRPHEIDPMRYIKCLESTGFTNVKVHGFKIVYRKISLDGRIEQNPQASVKCREVQFIHARRPPEDARLEDDPETKMRELERVVRGDIVFEKLRANQQVKREEVAKALDEQRPDP